jgi:hypothetical protein
MELKKGVWRVFKVSLLLLPVFLVACSGMQTTLTPENRIPLLDGGPHSGNWESRTMLLDYEYYKHSGEIKLSLQIKIKTKAAGENFRRKINLELGKYLKSTAAGRLPVFSDAYTAACV